MSSLEQKHHALLAEAKRRQTGGADNMRACFELLALVGAIDRSCAARLAPHRLSEGKFVLLFLLHGQQGGLSPHELAEKAGVTRATVTGLLDGLERDGFVIRRGGLKDRRRIAVGLTPTGQQMAGALFDEHSAWIASLFAGFSAGDRGQLGALLHRIRANLDAADGRQDGVGARKEPRI